jgi:hypothetical protein
MASIRHTRQRKQRTAAMCDAGGKCPQVRLLLAVLHVTSTHIAQRCTTPDARRPYSQTSRSLACLHATRDVAVSRMAAQLLQYANHPAYASCAQLKQAPSQGTPSFEVTHASAVRVSSRGASAGHSTWVNTLGDAYDPATRTWHRLPVGEPELHQLPGYTQACTWHAHQVRMARTTSESAGRYYSHA